MIVVSLLLFLALVHGVTAEETCSFSSVWRSYYGGSGTTAYSVATDSSGNVYVTDPGSNRIQKYSSDGEIISYWDGGTRGTENEHFSSPAGIAVDSSGNVYIADRKNHTIQKLSSRGFLDTWGSEGTGERQFSSPAGLAADSSGNVYVADTGNNRIQKLHSTGTFMMTWGAYGTADGQFNAPMGVTVDSSGHVYVADSGNKRIQKFTGDGTFLAKWGSEGTGEGQFSAPTGITADSWGNVYVADLTSRVQKFSPTGEYFTTCNASGSTYDVAVDPSGSIYILWKSGPHWQIGRYETGNPASLATSTPAVHTTFSAFAEQTTTRVTPATSLTTAPATSPATNVTPAPSSTTDYDTRTHEPGEQRAEQGRIIEEQGNILDQFIRFFRNLLG